MFSLMAFSNTNVISFTLPMVIRSTKRFFVMSCCYNNTPFTKRKRDNDRDERFHSLNVLVCLIYHLIETLRLSRIFQSCHQLKII